jgi:hypothetical protein
VGYRAYSGLRRRFDQNYALKQVQGAAAAVQKERQELMRMQQSGLAGTPVSGCVCVYVCVCVCVGVSACVCVQLMALQGLRASDAAAKCGHEGLRAAAQPVRSSFRPKGGTSNCRVLLFAHQSAFFLLPETVEPSVRDEPRSLRPARRRWPRACSWCCRGRASARPTAVWLEAATRRAPPSLPATCSARQ